MRRLKIGDKVRIIKEGHYNNLFEVGDVVYVVANCDSTYTANYEDSCPHYLSKYKEQKTNKYFGPWRYSY